MNATIEAVAAGEPASSSARSEEGAARGQLTPGARGVFGIAGVQIVATAAADGHSPLLVSTTGNVALKSGTQLLLVARGEGTTDRNAAGPAVGHASGASSGALGSTGS